MSRRHHGDIYDLLMLKATMDLVADTSDEQRDKILRVLGFGALYVTGVVQFVGAFMPRYDGGTRVFSAVWAGAVLWVFLARRSRKEHRVEQTFSDAERVWVKSWRPDGRRTPSMIMTRGEARARGFEVDEPYIPGAPSKNAPAPAPTVPVTAARARPAGPPDCGCSVPHHPPHQHTT